MLFQDRNGVWHKSQPHIATFNGKHNRSKSIILIFLFIAKRKNYKGFTALQLHKETGISYGCLRRQLPLWYRWRYVNRRAVGSDSGQPVWVYSIGKRGAHFVMDIIPDDKGREYIAQLKAYRARNNAST